MRKRHRGYDWDERFSNSGRLGLGERQRKWIRQRKKVDGMRERYRGYDKDNGIQNLRKIGNGREIEKERESQRECIRQRKKWTV